MIWQWRSPDPIDATRHLVMGRLAQLVERFVYTEDVGGSSPSSPTIISMQCRNVYPDPRPLQPKFAIAIMQATDIMAIAIMISLRGLFSGSASPEKSERDRRPVTIAPTSFSLSTK